LIEIRRIRPDDWRLLRDLRLAALAESPHAFGTRLEEAEQNSDSEWQATARASASGDGRAYFFAFNGHTAAGLVQARRRPPDDCLLFSMWVSPAARRQGAGARLVDAVAAWGAAWGARRIVLWVIANNEPAHRFYDRIGFRVLTSGEDAASGAQHGAFAMERPISVARPGSVGGVEEVG
jgi:ribosomal protein S18 acetylase RimI-like enzyme